MMHVRVLERGGPSGSCAGGVTARGRARVDHVIGCVALATAVAMAQPAVDGAWDDRAVQRLPLVVVRASPAEILARPFLQDIDSERMLVAKKNTVTEIDALPEIPADQYRRAFALTPGLLVSEINVARGMNINYRGIGDPHESQDMLTLKDGIPLSLDIVGDPMVYVNVPIESVDRIEFFRGGAALLYGPQPSGALNYVTRQPDTDTPFRFRSRQTAGSYGLYATHDEVTGTVDGVGYLAEFYHRQANGFRRNEDYVVWGGSTKMAFQLDQQTRLWLEFDAHESDNGEPGRLSYEDYIINRDHTSLRFDRVRVSRYTGAAVFEREFQPGSSLTAKAWGGQAIRFSRRQSGTGNNIDERKFNFGGADARLRHDWDIGDEPQTLTAGFTAYLSESPQTRERGAFPWRDEGLPVWDFNRWTKYGAVFAENRFRWGPLSLVPSVRVEVISQEVEENFNTTVPESGGRELADIDELTAVPLVGFGVSLDLGAGNELYANVSQGYKPPTYSTLSPTQANTIPSDGLEEASAWYYEAGLRGAPSAWLAYDASLFLVDYDDQFSQVIRADLPGAPSQWVNGGRGIYKGLECALQMDVWALGGAARGLDPGRAVHGLALFGNASLLNAEFISGILETNEPAFAPDYVVKLGVIYRFRECIRASLTGQFIEDHFWNDNNIAGTVGVTSIPGYSVWDLAVEWSVWQDVVQLIGGLNNLFDEDYYSRVRSDGIEPAVGRNWYAGISVQF